MGVITFSMLTNFGVSKICIFRLFEVKMRMHWLGQKFSKITFIIVSCFWNVKLNLGAWQNPVFWPDFPKHSEQRKIFIRVVQRHIGREPGYKDFQWKCQKTYDNVPKSSAKYHWPIHNVSSWVTNQGSKWKERESFMHVFMYWN